MHWIEDLVQQAVESGASYADVRLVTRTSEQVRVWDGKTEELLSHSSRGFGVRVLVDGAWGFAGSPDLTSGRQTVESALEVARASACLQKEPVVLAPVAAVRTRWQNDFQINLHTISFQERLDLLMAADAAMASVPGITQRKASMGFLLHRPAVCFQ